MYGLLVEAIDEIEEALELVSDHARLSLHQAGSRQCRSVDLVGSVLALALDPFANLAHHEQGNRGEHSNATNMKTARSV